MERGEGEERGRVGVDVGERGSGGVEELAPHRSTYGATELRTGSGGGTQVSEREEVSMWAVARNDG